jgi:hypothetical protein
MESTAYAAANHVASLHSSRLFRFYYQGCNGQTYTIYAYGDELPGLVVKHESAGQKILKWKRTGENERRRGTQRT